MRLNGSFHLPHRRVESTASFGDGRATGLQDFVARRLKALKEKAKAGAPAVSRSAGTL
jgi:hypothetical protein